MSSTVGFTFDDIYEYFSSKGGKVVYTDIVTHFKYALTDPKSQAECRVLFKDYVNNLATVTIEDGKKHLMLRPKYMRKLHSSNDIEHNGKDSASEEYSNDENKPTFATTNGNTKYNSTGSNKLNNSNSQSIKAIHPNDATTATTKSVASPPVLVSTTNNESHSRNSIPVYDETDLPPRPPPRKKNSFCKTKTLPPTIMPTVEKSEIQDSLNPQANKMEVESNQAVKKEIQELSRTPGRVREHAQILNKLASVSDFKLPMPVSSNSVHSQVVNKIRNSAHSDTDSGSFQILDALKKRWIIACSECDFNELLTLLKEDPDLCSYCDYIMGYNALHWAAKFNKPDIIKLIAGKYSVDPNKKSFSGCTALHIAAQFKHESIMKMLIDVYGANKDLRDNYGKKAYHYFESKEKKPNESIENKNCNSPNENGTAHNGGTAHNPPSATENLKNNLRNKISHQSMLVRNTLRKSKAFQRRKSMHEKNKNKKERPSN